MDRPHVLVNVAMTPDGKIDSAARKARPSPPTADKARVDRLRAGSDAVLVGGQTLLQEDPKLTVKSPELRAGTPRLAACPKTRPRSGWSAMADLDPDGGFMTAGPARRLIYTTARTAPNRSSACGRPGAEVSSWANVGRPVPRCSNRSTVWASAG